MSKGKVLELAGGKGRNWCDWELWGGGDVGFRMNGQGKETGYWQLGTVRTGVYWVYWVVVKPQARRERRSDAVGNLI